VLGLMKQYPDITPICLDVFVDPMSHELGPACVLWWVKVDAV